MVTDHSAFPYAQIARHARCILGTRNAFKHVPHDRDEIRPSAATSEAGFRARLQGFMQKRTSVQRPAACAAQRWGLAVVLLVAGWATAVSPATAQVSQPGGAFSSLTVRVAGILPVSRTVLDQAWTPPKGAELMLESPFYAGRVGVGAQLMPRSVRASTYPDLIENYVFLDWTAAIRLSGKVRALAGFRLGILQMWFDGPDIPDFLRREHEIRRDLLVGLDWRLSPRWSVQFKALRGRTYFYEQVDQTFITLGVGRTFRLPGWLQEGLR